MSDSADPPYAPDAGAVRVRHIGDLFAAHHPRALVIAVTLVGLALRLYHLGAQSLWVDEAATYLSSAGSPWWVITQRQYDGSVPPLYFLLVNTALRFGDSEAALRAVSVVAGTASIPLLYAVARRWTGTATAVLSAAFFAISPFDVWFSQEARAYATLVLLSLGVVRATQLAIDWPDAVRPRVGVVLCLVAAFYCHTVALALVPVIAVLIALYVPPARWKGWLAVFAAAGALILPGFIRYFTIYHYPTNHTDGSFDPSVLGFTLWAFGVGYSLGPSVAEYHASAPAQVARAAAGLIGPVLVGLVGLLALGARDVWRRSPRAFAALAALGTIPVAFAAAGSVSARYPYNVRYAVAAFPAFVVLSAAGVHALRPRWARASALALLGAVDVASLLGYYRDPRYWREDNRGASAFVARVGAVDRDIVVVSASYTSTVLDYYYRSRARRVVPFPGAELGGDTAAMARAAARLLGNEPRVWLFLSRTGLSPQARTEARALRRYVDACFARDTAYEGNGAAAILYIRRPGRRASGTDAIGQGGACAAPPKETGCRAGGRDAC